MHEMDAMESTNMNLSPQSSKLTTNHSPETHNITAPETRRPLNLPTKYPGHHGRCAVTVISSQSSGSSVCQSICSAPATTTPSREITHEISCYPLRKKISKLNKETLYGTVRQKCSGDILVQLPFSYSSPQQRTTPNKKIPKKREQRPKSPFPEKSALTVSSSNTVSTECSTQCDPSNRSSRVSFDLSRNEITVEFSTCSPRKKISKIDLDILFSSTTSSTKDIVAQYPYDSPRRTIPSATSICGKSPSCVANNRLLAPDNALINMTRDLLVAAERSKRERGVCRSSQTHRDPIRKRNREYALRTLQAYEMKAQSEGQCLASEAIKQLNEEKVRTQEILSKQEHQNVLQKLLRDMKQVDIQPTDENDISYSPMESILEFTVMDDRPLESLTHLCSSNGPERRLFL